MEKRREATNLAPVTTPLGRFIRAQRDARGWSQGTLAARAGETMTFTNISNIERGKVELPDPPTMIALARALDLHVTDLYVAAGFAEFACAPALRAVAEERAAYDEAESLRFEADAEAEQQIRAVIAAQQHRLAGGTSKARARQTGRLIDIRIRRASDDARG